MLVSCERLANAARYYTFQLPAGKREVKFLVVDSVGLEGGMLEHTPKGRRFEKAGSNPGERESESLASPRTKGLACDSLMRRKPFRAA